MKKIKLVVLFSLLCLLFAMPMTFAGDNETATCGFSQNSTLDSTDSDVLTSSDYYFDINAENSTEDGSIENPYRQLKANRIVSNSIIHLANGEYVLDTPAQYLKNVSFIGENAFNTTIRYYGSGFTVSSSLSLENLTLINLGIKTNANKAIISATNVIFKDSRGDASRPILSQNSSTTINLDNCTFSNIHGATYGGAIYISSGNNATLNINNSLFNNTSSVLYGGAIAAVVNSKINIANSRFMNTSSDKDAGGAIYILNSNLYAVNVEMINSTALFGGAVTSLKSNINLTNFSAKNNKAKYYGGAIYAMYRNFVIVDSLLEGNSAYDGGAIYALSVPSFIINSNRFINNNANNTGGAVYSLDNDVYYDSILDDALNNTFSNNAASEGSDAYEISTPSFSIGNNEYQLLKYNSSYNGTLPSSYDLRDYGYVSSVKDQGNNGNCWAFASIAALESSILKATGIEYDLSESNSKNLMGSYSPYGWATETNQGGRMGEGIYYFISWLGAINESDDDYKLNNVISPVLNSFIHVQNVLYLTRSNYIDNDAIKKAIMDYGAVATTLYAAQQKDQYYSGSDYQNHMAAIVGWDDNKYIPKAPGLGAWIVKNSWGSSWGYKGYFYVSYYDTKFAQPGYYESFAIVLNDTIRFDKNYQYDISGRTDYFLNESNVVWYKNKFTATDNEYLAAVSTFFEKDTDWELSVYVNGNLKLTQNGTAPISYKTIDLNKLVPLEKGDAFEVVFKITVEGRTGVPIAEASGLNLNYYSENMSFISYDGENWEDLYTLPWEYPGHVYYNNSQIACIKAFAIKNKLNTSIELSVIKDNIPTIIQSIVKDQYGNLVKSGKVTFTVEGKNIQADVVNGVARLENYTFKTFGNNTIGARFSATGYIASSTSITAVIYKDKKDVNLTVRGLGYSYGENGSIIVTLKDNISGNAISGAEVNVQLNGFNTTLITDMNGEVSVGVRGLLPNTYPVAITFAGNDRYKNVTSIVTLIINKANTKLTATNIIATYGSGENIIMTLTDANNNPINGAQVKIAINQISSTLTTDMNGNVYLSVNGLTPANYPATIVFEGNACYKRSSSTVIVVVNKADTRIYAPNVSVAYKDTAGELVATLTNVYGKTLSVNVNVSFNGESYVIKADSKGQISIPTGSLSPGSYVATISYGGNVNYNPTSTTANVIVDKANTTIYAPDISLVYKGDAGELVATLTNVYGKPLAVNMNVRFNGENYTVKANSNGQIRIAIANLSPGSYVATVSYGGNVNYNPTSTTANVIVNKADTVISASDVSVAYKNSNGKLVATLKNVYGNALAVNVNVNINGESHIIKANSKGQIIIPTESLPVGTHVATISYNGNVNYNPSSATANIVVKKANSSIYNLNASVAYKDPAKHFVAKLTDAYGNPIRDNVNVNINGKEYAVKSDSNGKISISTATLSPGSYIASISYAGNANYNPSSGTADVVVNKADTIIYAPDASVAYKDAAAEFVATLTNVYGKALNVNVNVNLNGVNYTVKADSNGRIAVSTASLAPGSYVATIYYKGNVNYNPTLTTANVIVNKANTTIYAPDVTVVYKDSTGELVAILTNVYGKALGVNVNVNLNGVNYTVKADSNGRIVVPTGTLSGGSYVATISYKGNINYNPTSTTANIIVNKADTVISASDVTVNQGDENGKLVATIKNVYGGSLAVNVNVNLNGVNYIIKADSKGKIIIPTADLPSGNYVATISYNGNVNYNPSATTANITVKK